jgi:hypothetical protein
MSEHSGWCPLESKDGRFLYYVTMSRGALRAISLPGGPEKELFSGISGAGRMSAVADIPRPVSLGLTLSPEEDLLLYGQIDRKTSDLMLVDGFR